MKSIKQFHFRRLVSVKPSPITTITSNSPPVNNSVSKEENIQLANSLISNKSLESAEFLALGVPPTILSVNSPPSVPVYIRRGSLLSIYGLDNTQTINNQLEVKNPIKHFLYGNYVSSYQKLISTTPFSILVSSISRNFSPFSRVNNKSFVSLNLDGANDWAILDNQALHVYTGNSLIVGLYRLPYNISRSLSKKLSLPFKTSTGLSKWTKLGYTLLSGRGQVALVGNGTVYNVNLKESEEILINKNNLLGISVNGPYDLQNCILKYTFPLSKTEAQKLENNNLEQLLSIKPLAPNASVKDYYVYYSSKLGNIWRKLLNVFHEGQIKSYNFLVGNQEFIKIIGPRSILLQSNSSNDYDLAARRKTGTKINPSGNGLVPSDGNTQVELKRTSEDYLNYVTIKDGKSEFKSTPDFREAIQPTELKK